MIIFRKMWEGSVFIYVAAVAVPRDEGHSASRTCTLVFGLDVMLTALIEGIHEKLCDRRSP
jgi:hypothetical protein